MPKVSLVLGSFNLKADWKMTSFDPGSGNAPQHSSAYSGTGGRVSLPRLWSHTNAFGPYYGSIHC